ncbi:unnamed protein product [Linum trigynum]|uniref:Uncharacterized protein n=1 Tax=Linum trigynum TaxID=586398 RepID=A0AAV2GAR2_9ROSI
MEAVDSSCHCGRSFPRFPADEGRASHPTSPGCPRRTLVWSLILAQLLDSLDLALHLLAGYPMGDTHTPGLFRSPCPAHRAVVRRLVTNQFGPAQLGVRHPTHSTPSGPRSTQPSWPAKLNSSSSPVPIGHGSSPSGPGGHGSPS